MIETKRVPFFETSCIRTGRQ